jgi:hypothetical protein
VASLREGVPDMRNVYWSTFRVAEWGNYVSRYEKLMDTFRSLSGGTWWVEPGPFVLFSCDHDIDTVAEELKSSLDPLVDLALIGMPNEQSARVIGAVKDNDLFHFMPFTEKR